jgi:hypothetical protein
MLAALAAAVAAVVAIGIWTLGQAQYLNDYCTTRVQPPQGATPESVGGRPAFLEGLTTVRCEYDGQPTVTVTDPLPLLGAVVLVLGVVAVAVIAFRSARRATG